MNLSKKGWRVDQGHHTKFSRFLRQYGYTRLESAASAGDADQDHPPRSLSIPVNSEAIAGTIQQQRRQQQQQRRKFRFRVRRKIRVLYSKISTLLHRLRNSYTRLMLALAATARESSLLPLAYKKNPRLEVGLSSRKGVRTGSGQLNEVETKYWDYIKKSVTDGELAYYTMNLKHSGIVF